MVEDSFGRARFTSIRAMLAVTIGLALGLESAASAAAKNHSKSHHRSRPQAVASSDGDAEQARFLVPSLVKPPDSVPPAKKPAPRREEVMTLPGSRGDDFITLGQKFTLGRLGEQKVTLKASGLSVQEVLGTISDLKHLNMVIDPSVTGVVAVDFQDVTLNTLLETLMATNGLTLQRVGNSIVVYHSGRYGQPQVAFIDVHFSPASEMATKINNILGTSGLSGASNAGGAGGGTSGAGSGTSATGTSAGGGGQAGGQSGFSPIYRLIADARTNRLIVHGTPDDIATVQKLVSRLDILMPNKIFKLTYLTPTEAINLLKASFFVGAGQGSDSMVSGGGAGSTGGAGGGGGAGGAGAGGGGGSSGTTFNALETDFARNKNTAADVPIAVTEATPRFIPLERDNNLLVIGSNEELKLVEEILPRIDHRLRQVLLRVQIVELSEAGAKQLSTNLNNLTLGGMPMTLSQTGGLNFSMNTLQSAAQFQLNSVIQALVSENKAKVLASPAVLAMDNRSSTITTSDQKLTGVDVSTQVIGTTTVTTQTPKTTPVGITLSMTPRILRDNSIDLNLHPQISSADKTAVYQTPNGAQTISLPQTRDFVSQELRVRDGETIVIGGLIQETQNNSISKVPILGDLPILGVLFSQNSSNTNRSEVQIFITPEIQPDV